MINLHERYLTLVRFSLSFDDPLLIIIMRFATFVAFMLPLAALAVPTPIPRQFNTTFTDAINRLNTAAEDASSSISVMLYDLGASQNSQEQTFYDGLQVASLNSQIAVKAVISIYDTVKSNNTFLDTEYVVGLYVYTMVKNELIRRFCSL